MPASGTIYTSVNRYVWICVFVIFFICQLESVLTPFIRIFHLYTYNAACIMLGWKRAACWYYVYFVFIWLGVLRCFQEYFTYTAARSSTEIHHPPQLAGKPFHLRPEKKATCAGLELTATIHFNFFYLDLQMAFTYTLLAATAPSALWIQSASCQRVKTRLSCVSVTLAFSQMNPSGNAFKVNLSVTYRLDLKLIGCFFLERSWSGLSPFYSQ